MRLKQSTIAFLLLLALHASTLVADTAPTPTAGAILAGTPEQYLSTCHADMDRAKSQMTALKAMKAPRDPIVALDTV